LLTYVNTPLSAELLWLLIILFLLTWFGNYFSKVKKIDGFVLLNVTKKDYYFVNRFLNEQVDNSLINKTSICYSIKKPYLLVFKGEDSKVIKKIIASLDKQMQTRPKQLKMIQYAAVIVSLLLLAILWRF
jgi:uncharacterized membrane protein YvbJ